MTERNMADVNSVVDAAKAQSLEDNNLIKNLHDSVPSKVVKPSKVKKIKLSTEKKAAKEARNCYKDFKRLVRKELDKTFKVSSLLEMALKFDALKEHNIKGVINSCQEQVILTMSKRSGVTGPIKEKTIYLFSQRIAKARELIVSETIASDLIHGKRTNTKKVLTAKEKKKAKVKPKKGTPLNSLNEISKDLKAVGVKVKVDKPKKEKKAKSPKDKAKKAIKKHDAKAGVVDNSASMA